MSDQRFFWQNVPNVHYVSPSLGGVGGKAVRIVSMVIEGQGGIMEVKEKEKYVIRDRQRFEIVAKVYEADRKITVLTIQKYSRLGGPSSREHFSFVGDEIDKLLDVVSTAKNLKLYGNGSFTLTETEAKALNLSEQEIHDLFASNEQLVAAIAEKEITTQDIIALGYRKEQLSKFERLLNDKDYREQEKKNFNLKEEALWQDFFEKNKWIFGYGLSYVFVSNLQDKKLEQVVKGFDLDSFGKRADAVMKTQALINSLCFIEIKHSETELLSSQYRKGVWSPSSELVGAVAQCQVTVDSAMEKFHGLFGFHNQNGEPTGEETLTYHPRSYLVIGNLNQLRADKGVNRDKYRSFELFRRHLARPEIITFDELYHRAKFIVDAVASA
jgi:hypothetical protein